MNMINTKIPILKSSLLILMLFIINTVSANGLGLIGDSNISLNKTVGIDENIILSITNLDSFPFYNITLDGDINIIMTQIPVLMPGEIKNVTVTIKSNLDIQETLRLRGTYVSDLGVGNHTYINNVDFENGISTCNLEIIQGDSVNWINFVNDQIKMINAETALEVATINQNSTYSTRFDTPQNLNYFFTRRGFQFTDTCQVIVLGSSGFINNPNLDKLINFNINVDFKPTTVTTTFIETNYNLDVFQKGEGTFTIKNTGNETAKNIQFIGEWFTFSINNFDLAPGITKGVNYFIEPILTTTNQTNQTYIKNLNINGNFNSIIQNFSIFVKYGDIDNNTLGGDSLINFIVKYCLEHPDASFCGGNAKVIYRDNTNGTVSIDVVRDEVKGVFSMVYEISDDVDIFKQITTEKLAKLEELLNTTSLQTTLTSQTVQDSLSKSDNTKSFVILVVLIFSMIVAGALATYLILQKKKRDKLDKLRRF